MSKVTGKMVAQTWRSEDGTLSGTEMVMMPANPAGSFSLSGVIINRPPSTSISHGGTCDTSISSTGCCSTSISHGGTCDTSISSTGCC